MAIDRLSRRSLLIAAGALALPKDAWSAPRPAQLNNAEQQEVARIQAYLNGIHTMQSRFEQVSDQGGVANGTIYIERPGRMRIVYDAPVPILIVATDGQVYYYDSQLEQVSRTTVEDTPAWFLLRPDIKVGGDVTLTSFSQAADALRLTLVETTNAGLGQVTLVLAEHPLELRQWTVLDAQQKQVTVTLANPQYNLPLNPALFYWTDPRPGAGARGG